MIYLPGWSFCSASSVFASPAVLMTSAPRTLIGGRDCEGFVHSSLAPFRTVPPKRGVIAFPSFLLPQYTCTRRVLPPFRISITRLGLPAKRSSHASIHFDADSFDQTNMAHITTARHATQNERSTKSRRGRPTRDSIFR